MKTKGVVGVLAVIGIFVQSVTVAQAGGGAGTAATLKSFFQCHSIDGANVGEVVSTWAIGSNGTEPVSTDLKVGAGILECRQVDVKNAVGDIINGDPSGTTSERLKCYAVSVKGPKARANQALLDDDFGQETVNISPAVQMICGPSIFTPVQ